MAERRPTLTASAPAGVRNLRSGRKKACGAVEQKKAPKQGRKKSGKKRLHSWPRLENEETAAGSNKGTDPAEGDQSPTAVALIAPGRPPPSPKLQAQTCPEPSI